MAPAGSRLADVAKAAALKAERTIIEDTLNQVQLEPAARRGAAGRQLQDPAQQNQRVWDQPEVAGGSFLAFRVRAKAFQRVRGIAFSDGKPQVMVVDDDPVDVVDDDLTTAIPRQSYGA